MKLGCTGDERVGGESSWLPSPISLRKDYQSNCWQYRWDRMWGRFSFWIILHLYHKKE